MKFGQEYTDYLWQALGVVFIELVFCTFAICQVQNNAKTPSTESKSVRIQDDSVVELHTIEGKVIATEKFVPENWWTDAKLLVNGGEFTGFIRRDGGFQISNVPPGSYVVEVTHATLRFESTRVDITSKGKIRARKVNLVQPSAVVQMPYPLKLRSLGHFNYFQAREQWRITDFLFSPMVLMMVLPLLIIMVLPKMMNAADQDTQREMQQSLTLPKYEMPELSEMMTSFFGSSSSSGAAKKPQRAIMKSNPVKKCRTS